MYNPNTGEFTGGGLLVLAVVLPPLIGGLLYAGYDVFMHGRDGQTLGKKVMKTRLVAVNGGRPDQATLIKRAAIFPGITRSPGSSGSSRSSVACSSAFLIGIFTLVDGIFVLTDSVRRQALHDKWSGTIVVKAQPRNAEAPPPARRRSLRAELPRRFTGWVGPKSGPPEPLVALPR